MPEGDTVWRTAARLHEALAGRVLVVGQLRWPSLATVQLRGMRTEGVLARGKHLLHRLDSGLTVHSHLRMEGQWRIVAADRLTARALGDHRLRAVLGTAQWTALGLRLGMLDVVATDAEDTLVGHLGPDLLGPDWDAQLAMARIAASDTTIGAALLDQRNLAGLGTMYTAETLFLERLGPWRGSGELTAERLARVTARAYRLLDRGRGSGVQSTTGSRLRGETTYVHGRAGRECRRCGTTVRAAPIGPADRERILSYCPSCQGGLGPTDDGRPQRPLGVPPTVGRTRPGQDTTRARRGER